MYFPVFRMKRLIVSDTFRVSCGAIFPFIFKNDIYVIITIFRIINLGICIEAEIFSNFRLLRKLTGLISLFWLTIVIPQNLPTLFKNSKLFSKLDFYKISG